MAIEVIQPGFYIASVGSALPAERRSNEVVAKTIFEAQDPDFEGPPTTPDWIVKATGIKNRHISDPEKGETTAGLATIAGKLALERSGVDPKDIGIVFVTTTTEDYVVGSVGPMVQNELGLINAHAPDMNAACSGFVWGMSYVDAMMARRNIKAAMLFGADNLSEITDYTRRTEGILFGSGAGAVVLVATDEDRGIIGQSLKSWGEVDKLYCPHIETDNSGNVRRGTIRMAAGRPVFEAGVNYMVDCSKEAMAEADVTADDVVLMIPHQANKGMIDLTARRLGIPEERVAVTIQDIGNTSSASIPITMDRDPKVKALKSGDIVLMPAAGAGFTGGAIVKKW